MIFGFDFCRTGRREWILGTPWGWFEIAWRNAREEREFVEACSRELTQPCMVERMMRGVDVYGRPEVKA